MWDLLVYGGLDVTLSQDPSILSRISSAHPLFILRRMNLNFQIILSSFSPSCAFILPICYSFVSSISFLPFYRDVFYTKLNSSMGHRGPSNILHKK